MKVAAVSGVCRVIATKRGEVQIVFALPALQATRHDSRVEVNVV